MPLKFSQYFAIALLLAGCSDDGGGSAVDAAVSDAATPDAVSIDATPELALAEIIPATGFVTGGTEVLLSGVGFAAAGGGDPNVTFAGVACADIDVINDQTLRCTTPPGPFGNADVVVENAYGTATLPFRYFGILAADGKTGEPGNLYAINPETGESVTIGPVGFAITGLALSPDGSIYGSQSTQSGNRGNANLISIDPVTGAGTVVGPLEDTATGVFHNSTADIVFVGERLLGWSEFGDDPIEIDPATGAVTVIGNTGIASSGSGLAASAEGTVHFAPGRVTANLFRLDPLTGLGTEGPLLSGGTFDNINSMTMLNGVLYAVDTQDQGSITSLQVLTTIDPVTGVMTSIGPIPTGIDSIVGSDR
jgi:hypothetical protein